MDTIYNTASGARFAEDTPLYETSMVISKNPKCIFTLYIFRLKDINGDLLPYCSGTASARDKFCYMPTVGNIQPIITPLY